MSECEVREVDHAQLDVSVVVPLANEQETLEELYSQIAAVLAQEERCFEVIFVDDGSADGSWEVIRRLHAAHENVRGIRFRRNFRKAAALAAGFAHARGAIVVTIDADLQDDPRSIVALLRKIAEGNDLVSGWKQDRKDPFTKRIASRVFGVFAVLAGLLSGTAALMPVVGPASLARPASVWVVGSTLLLALAGIFLSIGLLAELLTRLLHDRSASFVIAETLD